MPKPPSHKTTLGLIAAFIVGSLVFVFAFRMAGVAGWSDPPMLTPDKRKAAPTILISVFPRSIAASPAAFRLSDQQGKVVVLNYFATWCGPCMAEVPDLLDLAHRYQSKGVVFACISLDQDEGSSKRDDVLNDFISTRNFTLPILVPDADSPLWRTSMAIPQTHIYDKQGREARSITGTIVGHNVEKSLDQLLSE